MAGEDECQPLPPPRRLQLTTPFEVGLLIISPPRRILLLMRDERPLPAYTNKLMILNVVGHFFMIILPEFPDSRRDAPSYDWQD